MSQLNPQNFFNNVGGGAGSPTAKLKDVNDFVYGEIVDQVMAPATDFSSGKQKTDARSGELLEQLVVILQTDNRNWVGVSKIPLVDKDNPNSGPKPPQEDDGRRAVYVEPWTNIHHAVGVAVQEATGEAGPLLNGGKLGVKIIELKDTGKGNPLKVHQAIYEAPVAGSPQGFFGNQQPQSAPPQSQPAPQQAPPAQYQQPQAAPQQQQPDPWGTTPQGQPPF